MTKTKGNDLLVMIYFLVEIGPFVSGEELSLYFYCHHYLPLEKDMAHYLNKSLFHLRKDTLCQDNLKFVHWFWRCFLKPSIYIHFYE